MNSMEIGDFVKGLRTYIQNSPITQEKFAEGVTSTVNLSNVLSGNSGTSDKMRHALARKAGLTVDEIVALGKTEQAVISTAPKYNNSTYDEVASMGTLEIIEQANELGNDLLTAGIRHNNHMASIIRALSKQREELLKSVASKNAAMHAIDQPVVILNDDLTVDTCNRAATDQFGVYPHTAFKREDKWLRQVFNTGKKSTKHDDTGRFMGAYPIYGTDGDVKQAVLVVRALGEN
jgi:PAS domain-containing protein